jgi:cardiolipin synthase (CMP-forming)
MQKHSKKLTVSTGFTMLRIVLVPCIISCIVVQAWGWACALFVIAALTDLIDGALARFLNEQTVLGAYLDPIADKFLVLSCYCTLACIDTPFLKVPVWFVYAIVLKEVLLMLGAGYLGIVQQTVTVKPTLLGKGTALLHICFIFWLFICAWMQWIILGQSLLVFWVVVVATAVSFVQYLLVGLRGVRLCFLKDYL